MTDKREDAFMTWVKNKYNMTAENMHWHKIIKLFDEYKRYVKEKLEDAKSRK